MRILMVILFACASLYVFSQEKIQLELLCNEANFAAIKKSAVKQTQFKDSTAAIQYLPKLLQAIKAKGYVTASIDSFYFIEKKLNVHLFVGDKIEKITIKNGNLPKEFDPIFQHNKNAIFEKKVEVSAVASLQEQVLRTAENKGFPFAEVYLDSFEKVDNQWQSKLYITKNNFITFDTIAINGNSKVKRSFLRNYLGIKFGKPYNESLVSKINTRLRDLTFLESLEKPKVDFFADKAKISLNLKKRKSSQFDVLIGFLPGSSGQKLLVTGHATLHLYSLFGVGEEFYIHWEKLQPKTQRLDVKLVYPYVVGLPVGANVKFELYKKDTTFLDLDRDFGVQYQFVGNNFIKASLRQKTTIVTNIDTNFIKAYKRLPAVLDVNTNEFALNFFFQHLNYRFNPLNGYTIDFTMSVGAKKIKKNTTISTLYNAIENKTFDYLYDSVSKNIFQLHVELYAEKFWKIHKRMTIKTSIEGKLFYSKLILENEKYRIGGLKNLRGFDDQSIYTPYYSLANIEYRYLLSKNSFFYSFFNVALVKDNRGIAGKPVDFPYGFGAGIALETKVGIFGLSYAMGTQLGNPITFKSSKIHFGYVNYF